MKPAAVISGHTLAERYESLRQEVVEWSGRGVHGRALLMFKGMAAWVRCADDTAPSPMPVTSPSASRLPAGIEQNLIHLVANMTLATARENRP